MVLQSLRSSGHLEMHADLGGRPLAKPVYRLGADGMRRWSALPEVTAGDLRKALADLDAIHANAVPLADSLKYEYLGNLANLNSGKYDPFRIPVASDPMKWLGSDVRARRILNLVYANLLSQADRPRGKRPPISGELHLFSRDKATAQAAKVYSDEEIEGRILSFAPDEVAAASFLPSAGAANAFDDFDQECLR